MIHIQSSVRLFCIPPCHTHFSLKRFLLYFCFRVYDLVNYGGKKRQKTDEFTLWNDCAAKVGQNRAPTCMLIPPGLSARFKRFITLLFVRESCVWLCKISLNSAVAKLMILSLKANAMPHTNGNKSEHLKKYKSKPLPHKQKTSFKTAELKCQVL